MPNKQFLFELLNLTFFIFIYMVFPLCLSLSLLLLPSLFFSFNSLDLVASNGLVSYSLFIALLNVKKKFVRLPMTWKKSLNVFYCSLQVLSKKDKVFKCPCKIFYICYSLEMINIGPNSAF